MKQIFLNKIELQGSIGSMRINEVQGKKVINFSLRTERMNRITEENVVCETTWHNVVAWQGPTIDEAIFSAQKGESVHLTGIIRNNRYTASDGTERSFTEVLANHLTCNPTEGENKIQDDTWKFTYDEEIADRERCHFIGVISNGKHFLFYKTWETDGTEMISIYASIMNLMNDESPELTYPWTAENDRMVIKALNSLEENETHRFCGENSILHEIFKNK